MATYYYDSVTGTYVTPASAVTPGAQLLNFSGSATVPTGYLWTCESVTGPCVAGDNNVRSSTPVTADFVAAASSGSSPSGSTSGLPELTLEGGGLIAGAMLALWAFAWAFRVIKKQIEDS